MLQGEGGAGRSAEVMANKNRIVASKRLLFGVVAMADWQCYSKPAKATANKRAHVAVLLSGVDGAVDLGVGLVSTAVGAVAVGAFDVLGGAAGAGSEY